MKNKNIHLSVNMPEKTHREFKQLCAIHGLKMKDAIIDMVEREIKLLSKSIISRLNKEYEL